MASHKKKSDKEWKKDLTEYAITGKFGRGQAPSKTNGMSNIPKLKHVQSQNKRT